MQKILSAVTKRKRQVKQGLLQGEPSESTETSRELKPSESKESSAKESKAVRRQQVHAKEEAWSCAPKQRPDTSGRHFATRVHPRGTEPLVILVLQYMLSATRENKDRQQNKRESCEYEISRSRGFRMREQGFSANAVYL